MHERLISNQIAYAKFVIKLTPRENENVFKVSSNIKRR